MNTSGGWIADSRARRAIAVIAIAVVAIVAAGVIYLHPSFGSASTHRVLVGAPPSPTPPQLDGSLSATYDFVTPTLGWSLVTQNLDGSPPFWVFKTTDGAKHWVQQLSGQCGAEGTSKIVMFDRARGEVDMCNPLVAYRTANGGASWGLMALPSNTFGFVTFGDFMHGWYWGWSVSSPPPGSFTPTQQVSEFQSTTDGGSSWTSLPAPPAAPTSTKNGATNLQFSGAKNGWMGTDADPATVYSTTDGGLSWRQLTLPISAPPYEGKGTTITTRVQLFPGSGVMAVTSDINSAVTGFTSTDGGLTWRRIAPPPGNTTFDDYVFVDSTHWWVMRFGSLYKSSDAGRTWRFVTLLYDDWEYVITSIDASHAWAEINVANTGLAPSGGLSMTSDGGLHWTYVNVPQPRLS